MSKIHLGITYETVDDTYRKAYQCGRVIAYLYKNIGWKHPWTIEKASGGKFVSSDGYDCFTLTQAKEYIRREIAI